MTTAYVCNHRQGKIVFSTGAKSQPIVFPFGSTAIDSDVLTELRARLPEMFRAKVLVEFTPDAFDVAATVVEAREGNRGQCLTLLCTRGHDLEVRAACQRRLAQMGGGL